MSQFTRGMRNLKGETLEERIAEVRALEQKIRDARDCRVSRASKLYPHAPLEDLKSLSRLNPRAFWSCVRTLYGGAK